MSIVPHELDRSSVLQTRVLNILQALILAGILGFGKLLLGVQEEVGGLKVQIATLSTHVDDMKEDLSRSNLQQIRDDVSQLKAQQAFMATQLSQRHTLPQP